MNPKSAIQKGKLLEEHVAQRLVSLGIDPRADRQIGSGNGKRKGDIATDVGVTFECKNTKTMKGSEAAKQVREASLGYQSEALVWHPPNRPLADSIAIISLEDFLTLLKFKKDHQGRGEILDKYQVKSHLEKAVFHLKQVSKEL